MNSVDVGTGALLWQGDQFASRDSVGGAGGSLVGALVGAVVTQVASAAHDPSPALCEESARSYFENGAVGLIPGAYSPDHGAAVERARARNAAAAGDSER